MDLYAPTLCEHEHHLLRHRHSSKTYPTLASLLDQILTLPKYDNFQLAPLIDSIYNMRSLGFNIAQRLSDLSRLNYTLLLGTTADSQWNIV